MQAAVTGKYFLEEGFANVFLYGLLKIPN